MAVASAVAVGADGLDCRLGELRMSRRRTYPTFLHCGLEPGHVSMPRDYFYVYKMKVQELRRP